LETAWKKTESDRHRQLDRQVETVTNRERSERMFNLELVQRDFGSVVEGFASLAGGGRVLPLLLVAKMEATAALARAQEDAAVEAQDVLSQADEALVLG
jgi:hypothetical protein